MKIEPDNSGLVRAILMRLLKAYDWLSHDHLIAKLEAYGLDKPSFNLVNNYLRFWKQGKKLALRTVSKLMLVGLFPRDPI